MDKLWAPWRIKYLKAKKNRNCIFCDKKAGGNSVIFKTSHSVCRLNIFPYNNGHLMLSPLRHVKDLSALKQNELLDLFAALNTAKTLLDKTLKPHGYNIGINLSEAAGAGIPGHLHIHIVPRWKGDTNFMPVVSDTKIISQSLEELAKRLKDAHARTN